MKSLTKGLLAATIATASLAALPSEAGAAVCVGVTFGVNFAGDYSCNSLGQPTDIAGPLGGITFLDNDTLLIGGRANSSAGFIGAIDVVRDGANHITGFAGPATLFSTAPNIDGGLAFGPGGVLFATGYSNNTLLQIAPGSSTPDKIVTLDPLLASVGTLAFVPNGFAGAGRMKIASYNNGRWVEGTLTPDGSGTFDITTSGTIVTLSGGPEGIVYVKNGNAGFTVDSVLIAEWGAGRVGTYEIDGNGDPVAGTRRDFLNGLSGAEGAVIDPLTGDFLFSTFGGGDQVFVISGFTVLPPPPPPPNAVPEPATWALMLLGFGLVGHGLRSARRTVRVRFG
jgi:hypothetical protein